MVAAALPNLRPRAWRRTMKAAWGSQAPLHRRRRCPTTRKTGYALKVGSENITPEDFWQEKSIDQLAEEQGIRPVERLEDVLGRHADLWERDEDFEAFVSGIYERRRQPLGDRGD